MGTLRLADIIVRCKLSGLGRLCFPAAPYRSPKIAVQEYKKKDLSFQHIDFHVGPLLLTYPHYVQLREYECKTDHMQLITKGEFVTFITPSAAALFEYFTSFEVF